jgi:hypothetical protein
MCIKKWVTAFILPLLAVVWCLSSPSGVKAVTFEEEEGGEDELFEAPTPVQSKAKSTTVQAPAAAVSQNASRVDSSGDFQKIKADYGTSSKVRINRNIGFYYLLRAGYVVSDGSEIPSLGEVIETNGDTLYSTSEKLFIRLISVKTEVKPGDLWVIYRTVDRVWEPKSKFSGFWVNNLAVVKVLEVQKQRCQAEVKKCFGFVKNGDKVKLYDGEIQRWKDAHLKKPLPTQPIQCRVAGGDSSRDHMSETDFVILTAGSKKGVVEGQVFELRSTQKTGFLEKPIQTLRGKAQVFFVGPDYAMARILKSNIPIQKGFEAVYQP